MCVIITIEDGRFPTKSTLESAEKLNSHGGSIAWLNKNGTKSYRKGITAKQVDSIINKQLKPNGIQHAIIHFRIASVGDVVKKLCHPFEITKSSELNLRRESIKTDLLFHNGTWSEFAEDFMEFASERNYTVKVPKGNISDSRIMAVIAGHIGHAKMAKRVSGWNKVAILTSKGVVKYGTGWVNHEGNACSNDYFIEKPKVINSFGFWGDETYEYGSFSKQKKEKEDEDLTEAELMNMTQGELALFHHIKDRYDTTSDEIVEMLDYGWSIYDIEYFFEQEEHRVEVAKKYDDEVEYGQQMNYLFDGDARP